MPFPFLRITFFFVLGVISSVYTNLKVSSSTVFITVLASFVIYSLLYASVRKIRFFSLNLLISIALFSGIYIMGFAITWLNTPVNHYNHVKHVTKEIVAYSAIVREQPVAKTKSHRILVAITEVKTKVGWQQAEGKLFLYVKSDTLESPIKYGQQLLISGTPQKITPPKNPEEFNYKQYIGFQGIYYQHFITTDKLSIIGEGLGNSVIGYSLKARRWCEQVIKHHVSSPRERAIALALIVGVKDEIDADISTAYAAAGAMHVLAVSGLHVGVIYWIISLLFKPYQNRKYGKWIFLLVTLFGLWSYAFVTGLSASVLRAVTMFSFVTIGSVSNRQTNIYNTLSVSAFVLLCYNPYLIMAVGFQLSFLAVFGIVYLQPKIHNLFYVSNKWLDKVWAITSVSIAAQIATASLVVLYFHQLPSYFFISNLFVIPGAFLMLCLGLGLFALSWLPFVNEFLGWALHSTIWGVNELVFLIREIPYNTIDNIYLSTFQSWCIIIIIIIVLGMLYFRRSYWVVLMIIPVIGFTTTSSRQANENANAREIIFYAINKTTAIDFIQGQYAYLYADEELLFNKDKLKFHIAPYRLKRGLPLDYERVNKTNKPTSKHVEGVDLISWNGKTVTIITPEFKTNYKTKVKVNYIYVPRLYKNVYERILNNFEYEKIILKSHKSLPNYIVDESKIHDLTTQGALVLKLQ